VLEGHYALGLQALGALLDLELDGLAFIQGLVSIGLDRRKMDKDVLTGLALNKAVALGRIKPLHCSLFCSHFTLLLIH